MFCRSKLTCGIPIKNLLRINLPTDVSPRCTYGRAVLHWQMLQLVKRNHCGAAAGSLVAKPLFTFCSSKGYSGYRSTALLTVLDSVDTRRPVYTGPQYLRCNQPKEPMAASKPSSCMSRLGPTDSCTHSTANMHLAMLGRRHGSPASLCCRDSAHAPWRHVLRRPTMSHALCVTTPHQQLPAVACCIRGTRPCGTPADSL